MIILKQSDDDKGVITNETKQVIERICGDTYESILRSDDVGEVGKHTSNVIAHPTNDNLVVVSTFDKVLFVDATTLKTVSMIEDEDYNIGDIAMCGDGTRCVVTTLSTCVVYDITNIESIVTITTCEMRGYLFSSDIHSDGNRVVCGGVKGVLLYDITTSQPTTTLLEEPNTWVRLLCGCVGNSTQQTTTQPTTTQSTATLCKGKTRFVRFVYQPEGVLYEDFDGGVHLMDLSGVVLREFSGQHYFRSPALINNNKWLVTENRDNSIHIHDFTTGETIHKLYHPSSEGFRRFVYQPEQNKLIGVNDNGTIVVLAANSSH